MISMELTGEYDDVVDKLQSTQTKYGNLDIVSEDMSVLLDTVVQLDGGTRSVIAEHLPDTLAADYDSQAVVDALQLLERYDLVVLEGNTWKPGSAVSQ
jgi:hypothetical protein